jgi:methionyl-tRNA formyltransferase
MVRASGLRVVFFGTPAFAVPTLDRILTSRHGVVGVVTQPDRPRGRGHKTSDAPVKARALDAGLPVLQPATLKDPEAVSALTAWRADIGVVAAYGKILTEAVLATPRLGMINVHASLLPRHRGAAPVHRAVIAGDTETGVTIMRVVKALDAGPMLATVRRSIHRDETSEQLEHDLAALGADLLLTTLDRLAEGAVEETPQDDSRATYAHRLTKDDGIVDWTKPAVDIHNLIRGLHPWPHAFTHHHGRRIILHRSVTHPASTDARPGTVIASQGDALHVATGLGTLAIVELQSEGKRVMRAREFLAGSSVAVGDRLTPQP